MSEKEKKGDVRVRNLPEELYRDFDNESERRGISMGQLAKVIIRDYLDSRPLRKKGKF